MLHPSYSELMAVVNSEVEDGEQPIVQSRYSIVKATAIITGSRKAMRKLMRMCRNFVILLLLMK